MSPSTLSGNQKDLSLKYLQHLCSRSFQQRVHGTDMTFKYKPTTHTGSLVINHRKNPGCLCLSFSLSLILSLSERSHVSWTALQYSGDAEFKSESVHQFISESVTSSPIELSRTAKKCKETPMQEFTPPAIPFSLSVNKLEPIYLRRA